MESNLAGVQWRKSSYSGDQGGDCVEVGMAAPHIAVRDSKVPAAAVTASPTAFTAFLNWTAATERP